MDNIKSEDYSLASFSFLGRENDKEFPKEQRII
jgi:hypothetical protein